jgi:hypothetical protein
MTPSALNKICAHPVIISWVLGACALNAGIVAYISRGLILSSVVSDWKTLLLLLLALIPSTLLGYLVGMFSYWPLVRIFCSKCNAAPLKVGDQVMVLKGPQKGSIAKVYQIIVGQGGWHLARLDFGQERQTKFTDIFEEYAVLKIKTGQKANLGAPP